jgi:hypothetical protein
MREPHPQPESSTASVLYVLSMLGAPARRNFTERDIREAVSLLWHGPCGSFDAGMRHAGQRGWLVSCNDTVTLTDAGCLRLSQLVEGDTVPVEPRVA